MAAGVVAAAAVAIAVAAAACETFLRVLSDAAHSLHPVEYTFEVEYTRERQWRN